MQGKQLRKLEAELWRAADQLRANSKFDRFGILNASAWTDFFTTRLQPLSKSKN
jgi:hypothetical protein